MNLVCEIVGSEDGLPVVVHDVGTGRLGAVLLNHIVQRMSFDTGVFRGGVARRQEARRHRDGRVSVAGLESGDHVGVLSDNLHPADLLQHRVAGHIPRALSMPRWASESAPPAVVICIRKRCVFPLHFA